MLKLKMISAKQLYSTCLKRVLRGSSRIIVCEYSSKNPSDRKKNGPHITITAKSDFVTHHVNSSIAMHLKRQQEIANYFEEEERKQIQQRKTDYYFNRNTNTLEQTDHNRMNKKKNTIETVYSKGNNLKTNKKISPINYETEDDVLSDDDADDYSLDDLNPPDWQNMNLIRINNEFYKPSEITQSRSDEHIFEFRSKMNIEVASNVPKPIFKWNELNDLCHQTIVSLEEQHCLYCTPVQAQAIPLALSGVNNMIAVAQSGSGKTLAMILSALIHISKQPPLQSGDGPVAVILALTQEMAEEIQQLANVFCKNANINSFVLCDNIKKSNGHTAFANDVGELLITTPCHLYEFLRTKSFSLQRCSHFAIYEADKMIDMCLEDEIQQIETQIRSECQRVIWTSTWTSELRKLVFDDYHRLDVGSTAVQQNLSANIKQIIRVCDEKQKQNEFYEIINIIVSEKAHEKTLIFTETPEKADKVASILQRKGYHIKSIHNRKSTTQRNTILSEFQHGNIQFLVLTDVAAKNMNFSKISNVVNFDMPFCISEYLNRVRRTGRSYSIVTEEDGDLVDDLITILQQSKQLVEPGLFILKAANADSDDEISFAVPKEKGFSKYTIDNRRK